MNEVLLFTAIACLGILVQSFAGFAGSLTAIPLFALFLSPKEAIPTFNLVMLLIDAWLVFEARQHIQWARVGRLMAGGAIGIPIGAFGLKYLPVHVLAMVISVVTLVFAILFLLKIRINLKENMGTQMCVGLLSGFLGGSISESGPPVVIYGLTRDWDKNAFRTTLLTYFMCLCVLAILSYWRLGLLSGKNVSTFTAAIGPCFVAAVCGVVFKNRVGEAAFRRAILVVVIMVSLIGLIRSLSG
jgi:uncharacterized membrane protein YfcA